MFPANKTLLNNSRFSKNMSISRQAKAKTTRFISPMQPIHSTTAFHLKDGSRRVRRKNSKPTAAVKLFYERHGIEKEYHILTFVVLLSGNLKIYNHRIRLKYKETSDLEPFQDVGTFLILSHYVLLSILPVILDGLIVFERLL